MNEFYKTLRAYKKWLGWILVGASIVLAINMEWISVPVIQALAAEATNIIQALVPGGA
jgi:hypothetical protein